MLVVVVDLRDVNHRSVGPKESPVGQGADDQRLTVVGDRLKNAGEFDLHITGTMGYRCL